MNGLVTRRSKYAFDETLRRLQSAIEAKGASVFAIVDHAGAAAKAGMTMPPTQVLIFGSPKAGTPLMLAAPSLAIDLPLKILVTEEAGAVWMSCNSAEYLADRHGLAGAQSKPLAAAEGLISDLS